MHEELFEPEPLVQMVLSTMAVGGASRCGGDRQREPRSSIAEHTFQRF